MNILFTNGTLPIPDLPIAIGVSLDGPPELNDAVRSAGGYERVVATLRESPRPVFIQSVVTTRNAPVPEAFTASLTRLANVMGVIFSLYVPQKGDESGLAFALPDRDRLIERMLRLKEEHGPFIVNGRRALELMLSSTCREVTDRCDMRVSSIALDYRLRRRRPCCYGENVNCDLCAALTPFSQAARADADLRGGGIGSTLADIVPGGATAG